ncbi:membrane protein [Kitasatospora herbaricolor]|uniref:helix-turn-helix domain-containing protein n=1 Tax=Kitasatospora herbaricolor TaxID=68217 RepID=UPI0019B47E6D|nr:RodZ domain-containing protein [Kitasatospora herbaricolor]MDQ0310837.1 cytoskeletal protein RodZ [Kitasatospora herbaricolor]GGV28496.1 membrane protein [Kitasatospora herbaricolor]
MTIGKSPDRDNRRSTAGKTGAVPGRDGSDGTPAAPEPAAEGPSIGRVLSGARIEAGLTVDQVSTSTRVRVPIVHAIEEDDFGRCGGDFYARGHIRSIAKAVGIDGDELVARYDAAHGGAPATKRPSQLLDTGPIKVTDRRRPNWTAAMVAAICAVVALIGFNLVNGKTGVSGTGSASAPLPSGSGTGSVAAASPSVQPPAPAPSVAAIAAAPADKVTVKLVAEKDASWVSAVDGNGKSLYQNNIDAGQDQTFTDAKQIKLVIGNAGAVHVYVNGKDLGPAGKDGQVVHVTYTPGDPQAG